jgi:general secretion pathway protein D
VKVKVLIAQVDLGSAEEFGVEIGIQDSLLFDRGTSVLANGEIDQSGAPDFPSIGFPFIQTPGASSANKNAVFPGTLAGQALSALGVGTVNNTLGYGGLVLSAGNESINILMRALKDKAGVRILSRPNITTVENLQGSVTIGESVARISSVTQGAVGVQPTQNIEFVDVGVTLEVTPRVSPDGMIVMAVNVIKSELGDESDGVTISVQDGVPIKSANIRETKAETTLMARSGQTVVFSGLIEERKVHRKRGAPIISDLPWVGPLFSFEQDIAERKELLIIMTPYLIDDEHDINTQNQDEMDRMHWCLCDVAEVYGNTDYHGFQGNEPGIETIYPDADPSGLRGDPLFRVIDEATPPVPTQPRFETEIPQTQTRPMSRSENEVQQATRSTGVRRN